MIKDILLILIIILCCFFLLIVGYILFLTITVYKPKETQELKINNNKKRILSKKEELCVTTFNIGYCGLDMGQDFFADGGKMSRGRSKEKVLENLNEVLKFLKKQKSKFYFLQEVDVKSHRSYYVNELKIIVKELFNYCSSFAINYKIRWVHFPIFKPMGGALSGLLNFSRFKIDKSIRHQYPRKEKWPISIFELARCFLETRVPVEEGKELVLINSHLSAFDKGGKMRKIQLHFLKKHIEKEYENGNYIVVGGDWNHVLPGTDPYKFHHKEKWPSWLHNLPKEFNPKGFKWGVDATYPTVRTNAMPYRKNINFVSVIDGFLVSDNIKVLAVKNHKLFFKNSDHCPVSMKFKLN